jgi:hypothetical protein
MGSEYRDIAGALHCVVTEEVKRSCAAAVRSFVLDQTQTSLLSFESDRHAVTIVFHSRGLSWSLVLEIQYFHSVFLSVCSLRAHLRVSKKSVCKRRRRQGQRGASSVHGSGTVQTPVFPFNFDQKCLRSASLTGYENSRWL